jgi:predicted PurR-regulated permease PerM
MVGLSFTCPEKRETMTQQTTESSVEDAKKWLWQRRVVIIFTIVGCAALMGAGIWVISLIIVPIIYLLISSIIAYVIYPVVTLLERFLPHVLSVLIFVLFIAIIFFVVLYFIGIRAVQELINLNSAIAAFITHPETHKQFQSTISTLDKLGISRDNLHVSGTTIITYAKQAVGNIKPLVDNIFSFFIASLILASLCVYFLLDGASATRWLRTKTPLKYRASINFLLDITGQTLGGFVRGQVFLAVLMSILVGIGAALLRIQYAILLAMVVFALEFIPVVGAYISGAIGIIVAYTSGGWQTAIAMAILVTFLQGILDGQILAPRILGHAVGLHPITSLFALLVGAKLFGFIGAVLSCPIAGILQIIIQSCWSLWKAKHPEQFPEIAKTDVQRLEEEEIKVQQQQGQIEPSV